ncbi:hypothetical protein EG68_06995 [Paragonimus skrjabini miyazakii]|uniref:Uncharacterized protein n=1 Tax=Paragonimus skrjabini miyazakii TaxID=59628 RepID=A0A8S9YMX8_9TREM|nr:hypothetical protein EG68_06995 [Paragonimus skrjabini miyazakii]
MDLLDIFHVKATESLFRSLENLKQKSYRIVLTSGENGMQLRIITADNESSFQLNPEGTISNYFSVSEVLGSSGTFIGLFTGRLRVEANEESFKHAREGLIKDVEQNRQQKLEMLMYQAESASLLKTERIKKSQKSLKRVAPSKKPPSKVATTKDTDSSTTPQVAHHENKAKKTHAVKQVFHVVLFGIC